MSDQVVLHLRAIAKSYIQGDREINVITEANMTLRKGVVSSLIGPSGSGKSTLLHIAGLLDFPDSGEVIIDGCKAATQEESATMMRGKYMGYVYQAHHLLPEFSAVENVMMPLLIRDHKHDVALDKANELLRQLGLQDRSSHKPGKLSGGEQQMVAIARAIITEPLILLADEPTGNLDPKTAKMVTNLLFELTRERRIATLIVTHNMDVAHLSDELYSINSGVISKE